MHALHLALLICLLGSLSIYGQGVVITDLSPPSGPLTAERFTMVSLTNASAGTVEGTLRAALTDQSGNLVAELYTRQFTIISGQQLAYASIPWLRRFAYGSSAYASTLANRGRLGYGNFVLCHQFLDATGAQLAETCAEKQAALDLTFSLVYPFDGSVIETARPMLSWEDVGQYGIDPGGLDYELLLVEIGAGQSAATALEQNAPLLRQPNLTRNSLLYPVGTRPLTVGNTYAWRVRVYKEGNEVIASLPWTFTLGQSEAEAVPPPPGSYAMLTTRIDPQPHRFGPVIQIGFDNNEGITELDYQLQDLSASGESIASLPPVTELHRGLNTIDIPTAGLGLREGRLYRLEVRTPRNQSYFLQFHYHPGN